MCNIFVLILYIKNKQGVPPICAFFVSRHYLFILVFFDPCQESFLSKLMSGCPHGLIRGTDLEFSGMSSK